MQPAAEELRSQGVEVTELQADLATRDGVKQFWDRVHALGRSVDENGAYQHAQLYEAFVGAH